MASTTQIVSQRQTELLNNSHLRDINGGTFTNVAGDAHIHNSFANPSTNPLARLHDFIAASAMHDSKERFPQPKCHPFTRERILQRILNWVESDSCERILWVSGSAGTGKSAIAQTVSEHCRRNGRLAATFFFFRTSSERNTSERLVATLAYQIALSVPGAKKFVAKAVKDDLSVFDKDINSQLFHLIIHPLTLAAQGWDSTQQSLVIIDGLDECIDRRQQTDILSAICNAFMTYELPLRFLICSRPENDIQMRFEQSDLQSTTFGLVLDMDDRVTQDITTSLNAEFSRICREHCVRETPWPPEGVVQSLAERACGQFIYASTIIKFIDDRDFQPQQRLDVVLGTLPHGMWSPFAEIDLLYTQILDAVPTSKIEKIRLCLGIFIYCDHIDSVLSAKLPENFTPKSKVIFSTYPAFLAELLQLNSGGVEHLLRELHSVLAVQPQVSIRHTSFSDFLSCKTRSGRYYIDKEIVLAEFLGLLWATIPSYLNQTGKAQLSCRKALLVSPLYRITHQWRHLLPKGRHARATLQELTNIADFLEKNASDTPESKIVLILGEGFSGFFRTIIFWLSKEKLIEQNPVLWKQYISFFDKEVLLFLKKVEFLDPIHSIHFLAFKISLKNAIVLDLSRVGIPHSIEVFLNFFLDPTRSGKYHLTPQQHADIVVWMIQYSYPLPKGVLARRFQFEDNWALNCITGSLSQRSCENEVWDQLEDKPWNECRDKLWDQPGNELWNESGNELWNQCVVMSIGIHLSRASRCAEQLIEIIRSYDPDTFPLMAHSKFLFHETVTSRRLLSTSGWITNLEVRKKHIKEVSKGIARYLLDNSQMYEQWLTLKCEDDRKIQSSLTHKLGTVPSLHVVCYLLILGMLLFAGSP